MENHCHNPVGCKMCNYNNRSLQNGIDRCFDGYGENEHQSIIYTCIIIVACRGNSLKASYKESTVVILHYCLLSVTRYALGKILTY